MLLPFLPKPLLFLKSRKQESSCQIVINRAFRTKVPSICSSTWGASPQHLVCSRRVIWPELPEATVQWRRPAIKRTSVQKYELVLKKRSRGGNWSSWGQKERTRADLGRLSNCSLTFPRGAQGPHYQTYFLPQGSSICSSANHKIYREELKKKNTFNPSNSSDLKQKKLLMNMSTPASFSFLFWSNFICKWIMRSGAGQDLHSCTAEKSASFTLHFSHRSVGKQPRCNFGSSLGCEMSVLTFLLQKAAKAYKPKVGEFIFFPPEAH